MVGNSLNTAGVSAVKGSSNTVKLVCSYDGKILPRFPDGKLRYVGGETRVLAVDRSVPFSGLLTKLSELYGSPVSLRCQLPGEDLDALVSITSDEDLANLIEEYDRANRDESEKTLKLRAFLSPPRAKTPSPPGTAKSPAAVGSRFLRAAMTNRCIHHPPPPQSVRFQFRSDKSAADVRYHNSYVPGNPRNSNGNSYLVHNGNYWQ